MAARIVSSAEITEAIQLSKRLNVPIGRVLITSGLLTEKLLHSALDLQALIRDGEIPLDSALKALSRVDKIGCSVKDALEHLNFRPRYGKGKNNLADLLVDSNLVSQEQIDEALRTSFEYGTPLGSTLVFQGALSPDFFPSISAIQEQVTNGKLSNDEAIDELKAAFTLWLKAGDRTNQPALKTIEELIEHPAGHRKRHAEAKVASNPRAQEASEKEAAAANKKEEQADTQQEIATSKDDSQIKAAQAKENSVPVSTEKSKQEKEVASPSSNESKNINLSNESNEPSESNESRDSRETKDRKEKHEIHSRQVHKRTQPPSKHNRPGGRLIDLLSAAGLLDQDNLPAAYQVMLQDTHRSATFLVESGLIDDELRRQAERCHNLVRRGRLSPEQAIRALKSSQQNELTFREALSKEGVNQPAKLEKDWQTGIAAGVVGGFLAALFSLIVTLIRLVKKR